MWADERLSFAARMVDKKYIENIHWEPRWAKATWKTEK
jgi:hypothetical protein